MTPKDQHEIDQNTLQVLGDAISLAIKENVGNKRFIDLELLNVFPRASFADFVNVRFCHPKAFGYGKIGFTALSHVSNRANLILRKFRVRLSFPSCLIRAALFKHITHVIQVCTWKKMPRIKAGRVVAYVKDFQGAIKVKRIKNMFTHSMGWVVLAIHNHSSISFRVSTSRPFPTTIVCYLSKSKKVISNLLWSGKRQFDMRIHVKLPALPDDIVMLIAKSPFRSKAITRTFATLPIMYSRFIHLVVNRIAVAPKNAMVCPFFLNTAPRHG